MRSCNLVLSQPPGLVSWYKLCCVSQELSQPRETNIEGVMGMQSMLFAVEVSFARISLDFSFCFRLTAGGSRGADKGEEEGREGGAGFGAALVLSEGRGGARG